MTTFVRYLDGAPRDGRVDGDKVVPLTGSFPDLTESGETAVLLADLQLLAPVVPGKIVAVGPNYRAHLGGNPPPARPYLWIKPTSALLDPEGVIELPADAPMVCHESELAIVIGRTARDVTPAQAKDCIFGYTCINDVSVGTLTDMPAYFASQYFVDGKIGDTLAPLGPVIVTGIDPTNLRVQCRVNGETRQDHNTNDQIWNPFELVSIISGIVTLNPGDVVASGSPPRPGPLTAGDVVEVELEGIGVLRNSVRTRGA